MLTPIANSAIPSYPLVQKSTTPSLLSLPVEIQEEVENRLDYSGQQALFKALTTVTRNGEPVDSPALKLHLLQHRIAPKYQPTLASSDASLQAFALSQLQSLWTAGRLDKVVEKPALFELLRLIDDPATVRFLKEKIQQEPELKKKLLNWVERSKTEEVQAIAANALTLLVKAEVALSRQDFKGIRVPKADLSYGIFNHTQFEGADLSHVDFHGAQLRDANLQKANLTEVNFGEPPAIEVGHPVEQGCPSPDGRWLALSTQNSEIKLYQTKTLELVHTLAGHSRMHSVTFSPNSELLASRGRDSAVKLWRVENGEILHTLEHSREVLSVAFSPNGEVLASGSGDRTVKLWRVANGGIKHTLIGHHREVECVSFSPDGEILASGSSDNRIQLWRVESGQALRTLVGHTWYVKSVSFSPNGEFLVSGSSDRKVRLWRVSNGEALHKIHAGDYGTSSVEFSPDGKFVLSMNNPLQCWSVENGEASSMFSGYSYGGRVTFLPDGKVLALSIHYSKVSLAKAGDWKTGSYWNLAHKSLNVTDMSIQDAEGLSPLNVRLLKQKGVQGEPS